MTKSKHGLVFARVTSKATGTRSARKGWDYSLSNGCRMFLSSDDLCLGKWYFFEMEMDSFKNLKYISHHMLDTNSAQAIDADIQLMKKLSHDVVRMWRSLEDADRQIFMRHLGIGLTGLGAASATATGVASLLTEGLFGAATGGLSLVVGGALAGLTYLQYEERKSALEKRMQLFTKYQNRRSLLARALIRAVPNQYAHLDCFDPQVQAIVTRLSMIIKDFDFQKFCQVNDDTYEYAYARA
jgi:hypothetical protein